MPAVGQFAQTSQFKTLATVIKAFYADYVETAWRGFSVGGTKSPMTGFLRFEGWMANIKRFTEVGGDGRFFYFRPKRPPEMEHFSVAFLWVMGFTFKEHFEDANNLYRSNFVWSFTRDPVLKRSWMEVLNAMYTYLQLIESEGDLENHWLKEEYSWCRLKLADGQATAASPSPAAGGIGVGSARTLLEMDDVLGTL